MSETIEKESISDILNSVNEANYGENYQAHVLAMYKDFVASAETVSDRRNKANAWFLPICTAFLGVYSNFLVKGIVGGEEGIIDPHAQFLIALSALGGIAFSLIWLGVISSHKDLNSAKFAVILQIEEQLPLAPFKAEYWASKRPKKVRVDFSKYESYMPWAFIAMYCVVFVVVSQDSPAILSSVWLKGVISLAVLLLGFKIGPMIFGYLKKRFA